MAPSAGIYTANIQQADIDRGRYETRATTRHPFETGERPVPRLPRMFKDGLWR